MPVCLTQSCSKIYGLYVHESYRETVKLKTVREKSFMCISTTFYHYHQLVYQRLCHVLSRLCDNVYKRTPAICHKSKCVRPDSRSVPIQPAYP